MKNDKKQIILKCATVVGITLNTVDEMAIFDPYHNNSTSLQLQAACFKKLNKKYTQYEINRIEEVMELQEAFLTGKLVKIKLAAVKLAVAVHDMSNGE